MIHQNNLFLLLGFFMLFSVDIWGQCLSVPVSLEERVSESSSIVLGELVDQECYIEQASGMIYTANRIKVTAWLKNPKGLSEVCIITNGGMVGNRAVVVKPSLQIQPNHEYLFFLEADNYSIDHKQWRAQYPHMPQSLVYAVGQGAIIKQFGLYRDMMSEPVRDEEWMFTRIQGWTKTTPMTPDGLPFQARPFQGDGKISSRNVNVSSFGPNPTPAGTTNASDFLTIQGSNLGTSGTIFYRNADNGGSNFISAGVPSDYVNWTNTSITHKVPNGAGSGTFTVDVSGGGNFSSGGTLTIPYSHINVNSAFFNFTESTRQEARLVDMNGSGGYDFVYNNGFNANTAAVASFERALNTWRCGVGINFNVVGTSAVSSVDVNDGVNIITFTTSLPAGTLGRTFLGFAGTGNGSCQLNNTLWYIDALDIEFRSTGWNFGPGNPTPSQSDFESVALHELGHAIALDHVINTSSVMHFAITNGTTRRTLSGNELNGANAKIQSSLGICPQILGQVNGEHVVTFPSSCFLPVALISFQAERVDESTNELSWIANESENAGFIIERSKDGELYDYLSFVRSHGEGEQTYTYEDRTAGKESWYYRLSEEDLSGSVSRLGVRFVAGAESELPSLVSLPGKQVQLTTHDLDQLELTLYHLDGRMIHQSIGDVAWAPITLQSLPGGIYIYQIKSGAQIKTDKILLLD